MPYTLFCLHRSGSDCAAVRTVVQPASLSMRQCHSIHIHAASSLVSLSRYSTYCIVVTMTSNTFMLLTSGASQMFRQEFCTALIKELENFEKSGLPLRRPNSMNNYGVVVNEMGLEDFISRMQKEVFM